jgi:small secreted domain DUF320
MIVKRQVLRIAGIAAIAAGGVLALAAPAQADGLDLLSGNQINLTVQAPITVSGNAISVGGSAVAGAQSSDKASAQSRTWSRFAKTMSRTWS